MDDSLVVNFIIQFIVSPSPIYNFIVKLAYYLVMEIKLYYLILFVKQHMKVYIFVLI